MHLSVSEVSKQIYQVRGARVMLDWDLATLFQTETRALNQTVQRNQDRFPEGFRFRLRKEEYDSLISQKGEIHKEIWGGRRVLPYAYTEVGVLMLSCVLNTHVATQVSIVAVKAFAQSRSNFEAPSLESSIDRLERTFGEFQNRIEVKLDSYLKQTSDKPKLERVENEEVEGEQGLRTKKVLRVVSKYFDISVTDLKGLKRTLSIAHPRQICMYLLRSTQALSFSQIGEILGGRDHTTVLHAYKKIQSRLESDNCTRTSVNHLLKELE